MYKLTVIFALLAIVPTQSALAQVLSSFDSDDEGWVVADIECYDGYSIDYGTRDLTWQDSGGDPGGHVTQTDNTPYCSFFSAPAIFLGDQTEFINGHLEFSLSSTATSWPDDNTVVLFGSGLIACRELTEFPPEPPDWRHYVVSLVAGDFTYEDGNVVSESDFAAIMADLQKLLLPAEYGAGLGETVGLDTVWLGLGGTPVTGANPASVRLSEIYPNPFNPQTTIMFALDRQQHAEVAVYDLTGRLLGLLADRTYDVGNHSVVWNGKDEIGRAVPSGTYVVRLETESGVEARKVMLLR